MPERTFTWRTLLGALAFMVLGFFACLWAPIRPSLAPETADLTRRLHQATLDRAHADSSLVGYRRRSEAQAIRVASLEGAQAAQTLSFRRLVRDNATLTERLQAHPESSTTLIPLLGQGIALQGAACEAALSTCDSTKAVLREQVVSADSAFNAERQRGIATFRLATDATGSAVRWEAKAGRFRAQRNLFGALSVVLLALVVVK